CQPRIGQYNPVSSANIKYGLARKTHGKATGVPDVHLIEETRYTFSLIKLNVGLCISLMQLFFVCVSLYAFAGTNLFAPTTQMQYELFQDIQLRKQLRFNFTKAI